MSKYVLHDELTKIFSHRDHDHTESSIRLFVDVLMKWISNINSYLLTAVWGQYVTSSSSCTYGVWPLPLFKMVCKWAINWSLWSTNCCFKRSLVSVSYYSTIKRVRFFLNRTNWSGWIIWLKAASWSRQSESCLQSSGLVVFKKNRPSLRSFRILEYELGDIVIGTIRAVELV